MTTNPIPAACRTSALTIFKRDADCYDVTDARTGRVAALRSEFTEAEGTKERTMIPGTWSIRWEFSDPATADTRYPYGRRVKIPEAIEALRFQTAHEAFAFLCSQVLE